LSYIGTKFREGLGYAASFADFDTYFAVLLFPQHFYACAAA